MQIGEFAKLCDTKISVLRHYDKAGILLPVYIDRFTGYRYYEETQKNLFLKIKELQKAGFSLSEIKDIVSREYSGDEIIQMFQKKKQELQETLRNLEEVRNMMMEESQKEKMQEIMETYCWINENINLPFETDDAVIGKWEIIGEFIEKEDFYKAGICDKGLYGDRIKEIYFLPNGEKYWCYSWTKGKLMMEDGYNSWTNDYTTEDYNGEHYMFVDLKSYTYRKTGKTTVLVLRQLDQNAYTKEEIARKDNLAMPFVTDERVLGKWIAHSYCRTKEEFSPQRAGSMLSDIPDLFFKSIEFQEGGHCICVYGEETISGDEAHTWTKGYWLRKFNDSACAYEIQTIEGVDYLIVEWKCGDYRWGGFETDYYAFVRA